MRADGDARGKRRPRLGVTLRTKSFSPRIRRSLSVAAISVALFIPHASADDIESKSTWSNDEATEAVPAQPAIAPRAAAPRRSSAIIPRPRPGKTKPAAAEAVAGAPDALKSDAVQSEPIKSEAAKSDPAKSDPAKSEPAKPRVEAPPSVAATPRETPASPIRPETPASVVQSTAVAQEDASTEPGSSPADGQPSAAATERGAQAVATTSLPTNGDHGGDAAKANGETETPSTPTGEQTVASAANGTPSEKSASGEDTPPITKTSVKKPADAAPGGASSDSKKPAKKETEGTAVDQANGKKASKDPKKPKVKNTFKKKPTAAQIAASKKVFSGKFSALRKRAGENLVKTNVDGFSFYLPGDLIPGTSPTGGSYGARDDRVHVPKIRFPIEKGPAYVNSQVWGWGGTFGLGSSECDLRNYSYPWRDNFCEARSWVSGVCPGGIGHQGVDIRAKTCDDDKYWAVAAEAGKIIEKGVYGITLRGNSGFEYTYLHVNTPKAKVKVGQRVKEGQKIALISNHYGGTPTSIHLHFEIRRPNPKGGDPILISPYASLITSYLRLMSGSEEKAAEALKTATVIPRPKQPPKFKGFSGRGPRGWGGGLRDCRSCPLMKRVPGGSTKIGSPNSESGRTDAEGPRRTIKVSSFVMSRNEVTRRSWRACVKAGYCRPAQKGMTWKSLNHPITGITLRDITGVGVGKKGYLAWLNKQAKRRGRKVRYRLPSEAEWEHAARAGKDDAYVTGKTPDPRRIAFKASSYKKFPEKIRERKSPVTRRSLRANRWGFYEMAGNVWEFTADCWARNHRFTPRDGKARGQNCSTSTIKGGSVFTSGRKVRSATREPFGASAARRDVGFRVVREKITKSAKKKK